MCEFFPEVEKCCIFVDLHLAILFISLFCIMTGVLELSVLEQKADVGYHHVQNVTVINDTDKIMSGLTIIIPTGVTAMSIVFIITGTILMAGAIANQEGIVQVFVWVTFLNVIVGYVLVAMVGFECVLEKGCMLGDVDWLSGSAFVVIIVAFLTMWLYFIIVANSYVLNSGT